MKSLLPAAVAIGVGIVILLGYFFADGNLLALRLIFTDWAVVLGALAVLLGLLNLLLTHARRVDSRARGWLYSLLTALAAVGMLGIGLLEAANAGHPTLYEAGSYSNLLFTSVIVAAQAALASLVMFFLVAASVRMLGEKRGPWSILFLAVVVITLVAWLPLRSFELANQFQAWLVRVPAAAGARGILLGVALGTVAIGLRVLTGMERPYKD